VPAALRDLALEVLHRPPHCLHFVSHLFHHECTYCLAYDYELICVEPAVHLHIFMLYVYYTIYTLLMKLLSDKSLYSSSGGRSSNLFISVDHVNKKITHPSRILLAETGPFVSFFFCASPSADTLNRSRTSPVFIDPRPEFCCVTTEDAMFILNRCRLSSAQESVLTGRTYPMIFSSNVPRVISLYTLTTFL
jgi:hypothetical protein